MNEQPKSKVLMIIIGILLSANIIMLSFFIWNNNAEKKERAKEKNARNKFVSEYLEKEVGFSAAQLNRYDSLSKKHRTELKATFGELSAERKKTFKTLASAAFSDSAIRTAASEIHDRQKILEFNMLRHLKEIRDICTADQLTRFDTGFYKIFGKRGETLKEK